MNRANKRGDIGICLKHAQCLVAAGRVSSYGKSHEGHKNNL